MNIIKRISKNGEKEYYSFELGWCAGSRIASGNFTYTEPINQIEKNHNKEVMRLPDTRKSELFLEHQAIGSGFIPEHKFKGNFLEYYREYVDQNKRKGNRHLKSRLIQFKNFMQKRFYLTH
jgi:hypothetical protein